MPDGYDVYNEILIEILLWFHRVYEYLYESYVQQIKVINKVRLSFYIEEYNS